MWPSCPYKPLCFQNLRYPQFLSNFQSPKFKFSISGKNVCLFGVMTITSVSSDINVPLPQTTVVSTSHSAVERPLGRVYSACGECQGSLSTTKGCCPSVAVCSCCSRCYVFRGFKERLVFCVLTRWRRARRQHGQGHYTNTSQLRGRGTRLV